MRHYVRLLPPIRSSALMQRGFSLIEMVIVILVMGIISALVGMYLLSGIRAYLIGSQANELSGAVLPAIERLKRDMREVRSAADITSWTATQLSFVGIDGQAVTYQYAGTQLLRNTQPMINSITTASFGYLQADGQSLPTINTEIRAISFTMTAALGDYQHSAEASVRIRNAL